MKNNSFLLKMFFFFFSISLVLIFIFTFYIFKNVTNSITSRFYEDRKTELYQIQSAMEQKVKIAEGSLITYSSTTSFQNTINETLTAEKFKDYNEFMEEINRVNLLVSDMGENKFSFVSFPGRWKLDDGKLTQVSTQSVSELKSEKESNNISWSNYKNDLLMKIYFPVYSKEKDAMGMIRIPNREFSRITNNNAKNISLYGGEKLIYGKNQKILTLDKLKNIQNSLKINQSKAFKVNDVEFLISKSSYNNWLYVMKLDYTEEHQLIWKLRLISLFLMLMLLLVIGIVFFKFSSKMSRPIEEIQKNLGIASNNWRTNELDLVARSIDRIKDDNQNLASKLLLQKNQLETLFVMRLFRNHLSEDEINYRAMQQGYKIKNKKFYTVVLSLNLGSNQKITDEDLFLLAANNIVHDSIPSDYRLLPIVQNDNFQATIVMLELEELKNYYKKIQSAIEQYLKVTVSIGVSKQYDSLIGAKNSLNEAKEVLVYSVEHTSKLSIYDGDWESRNKPNPSRYPIDLQNDLFESIRLNDENSQMLLNETVDTIFEENKNSINLNVSLVRFINEIIQFAQLNGMKNNEFGDYTQIYINALTVHDRYRLKKVLYQRLLLPIIEWNHNHSDDETKRISNQILDIIHAEYDQNLTLESISLRLHYNAKYLGRIFSKDVGENFGEYVQRYRLSIAQSLLRDTKMTVNQISLKLQYKNPQNFIRFFKKKLNMTPVEYRDYYLKQ